MLDALFLIAGTGLVAVAIAYIHLCDRL